MGRRELYISPLCNDPGEYIKNLYTLHAFWVKSIVEFDKTGLPDCAGSSPVVLCWEHWLFASIGTIGVSLGLRWMYQKV